MCARATRRTNFHVFLRDAFKVTHSRKQLSKDPYLEALSFALETAATEPAGRLMVTMPPRYLKSFAASIALVAWILGRDPACKVIVASYADGLAKEQARIFRSLVSSPFYRNTFPRAAIAPKSNTSTEFVTRQGGGRRAVTVGGSVTGMGADLLIIDDIMKASDATSEARREEARRYFDETLYTRLNDKSAGSVIVLQQRLHQDDLVAHLKEKGTFKHLNLPAIAEAPESHALYYNYGWDRDRGDVLAPTREDRDTLDQIRRDIGDSAFRTQYQQDPASAGSAILDFSKVTVLRGRAEDQNPLKVVQAWDTAIKDGPNCDYSVCVTFGWDDEHWIVLDVTRRRMKFGDLKTCARRLHDRWKPELVVVEDSANGSALATEMRGEKRLAFRTLGVKGSKQERFAIAADWLETGKIALLPEAPYFQDLRRELVGFPEGRHDDQVDAISLFVRRARMARPMGRRETRRVTAFN